MALPEMVDRTAWLAARRELLTEEKALTRRRDALSVARRELPMVEVTADYRLEGSDGPAGLADLFAGRHQLIVYHFMFDPEWEDGCSSCTAGTDEITPGFLAHLAARDTSYAMVSRAPLAKLRRWQTLRGWEHIAWYSSYGSAFNYDFGVTVDESAGAGSYNYRTRAEWEALGSDLFTSPQPFEMPGRSCFLSVDGRVFHTYSQYARGLESTGGSYYFLDLTALGRQEDWEQPAGRAHAVHAAVPDFTTDA